MKGQLIVSRRDEHELDEMLRNSYRIDPEFMSTSFLVTGYSQLKYYGVDDYLEWRDNIEEWCCRALGFLPPEYAAAVSESYQVFLGLQEPSYDSLRDYFAE